jgi:hypothetical protein
VTPDDMSGVIIAIVFATAMLVFVFLAFGARRAGEFSPTTRVWIHPKDNPGLLLAAMRAFEGSGQIYFEGIDPPATDLKDLAGARGSDDFVVIPLTSENVAAIWKLLTWEANAPSNFIHVQIAAGNRFVFGAHDWFHPNCVAVTDEFPLEVLDRLVADGVIRSYKIGTGPEREK